MSARMPVALVTGGTRGIGLAIAKQLGGLGIHVIIGARKPSDAEAGVRQIGSGAESVILDVTDETSRLLATESLLGRHGHIDILMNNAGIAIDRWVPTQKLDLQALRTTMETNLYGPLRMCQLLLPAMQRHGHGRIVNVSTELASLTQSTLGSTAAYRMSKAALNMLTRLLALELRDYPDILVNAAAPGWVKTDLGGQDAPRTPAEGARTPVWLATLPAGGPTGGFFRDEQPHAW